jgi:hypothetical protein
MSKHIDELSESELIRAIIIIDNKLNLGYLDEEIVSHVETFTTNEQWDEWVENSNKARLFVHLMTAYKPTSEFFKGHMFSIDYDRDAIPESLTGRKYSVGHHKDCQMALYKAVVMYHLGPVIRTNITLQSICDNDGDNHV